MIDTRTGEIVGGSPYISHKQVKKTKDFTPAELNANMEKAVRGLCGVRCKKGLKSPRIIIKRVSDHANFRMLERGVSPELVKSIVMEPALTRLCNDPRKVYYLKGDVYVIVGIDGTICTCVRKKVRGNSTWRKTRLQMKIGNLCLMNSISRDSKYELCLTRNTKNYS